MKACKQCGVVHPATNEYFGTDNKQPDALRAICKGCFSANRSGQHQSAVQALRLHDKVIAKARQALSERLDTLSAATIQRYEQIVRGGDAHRAQLQKKILDARQVETTAQRVAAASPSLKLVQQAFGSPILLSDDELRVVLQKAKTALGNLVGADEGPARDHVTAFILRVTEILAEHDERAAFLVAEEEAKVNGRAIQRALDEIHDTYLSQIRAAKSTNQRNLLRLHLWKMKRGAVEVARDVEARDSNGASKSVVATACAKEFDRLARLLYGTSSSQMISETDSLENIQSRMDATRAAQEWLEQAERNRQRYWDDLKATDIKRWEAESKSLLLQVRGQGVLAQLERDAARKLKRENPEEYRRRALLALQPKKVSQDVIVYRVPTDEGMVLMWPDGRPVKYGGDVQHAEIVKDHRGWFLNPSPLGADIDDGPPRAMELIQDPMDCDEEGYPKWKWVEEGSRGIYEQQSDGSFKRTDIPSPWGKATPIIFQDAEPPASPEHTVFRFGGFWTPAQVAESEKASWSDTPPVVLEPLTWVVADSLASAPPPTAAQLKRMNAPAETVWQKHARQQRQEAEREQAMLRGVYIWKKEN